MEYNRKLTETLEKWNISQKASVNRLVKHSPIFILMQQLKLLHQKIL